MISSIQPIKSSPLIKVCGITHQSDLDACIGMGVNFCGFIFHPASARYISPFRAGGLRSGSLKRVGVFVKQGADEINRIMDVAHLDFAQLHGDQSPDVAREIGAHRVVKVLWPQRYADVEHLLADMENYADSCAFFLLDAGMGGGGSGLKIDWKMLAGLNAPRPWFLAGGLSAESLPLALNECRPCGVDLNSGVEWAPGYKSAHSLLSALHIITKQHNHLYS